MNKTQAYTWAQKRIRAQVLRHIDRFATLANTAAILKEYFPNFFWVGFYFLDKNSLILGPFQGPPACVKLALDKGACAAAVREGKTIIIPNVHEFPGHIACDDRSNSEIVVPIFNNKSEIMAVLDVDSQSHGDFDKVDAKGLETVATLLQEIV